MTVSCLRCLAPALPDGTGQAHVFDLTRQEGGHERQHLETPTLLLTVGEAAELLDLTRTAAVAVL